MCAAMLGVPRALLTPCLAAQNEGKELRAELVKRHGQKSTASSVRRAR